MNDSTRRRPPPSPLQSGAGTTRRRLVAAGSGGLALSLGAPEVRAGNYPAKPNRLVIGFAPCGSADTVARQLAERLREKLGVTVIVENRPGAKTLLTIQALKSSPPDGYTLMLGMAGAPVQSSAVHLHISDLGRVDADEQLHFVVRMKDFIRRRGENVSPFEVETIVDAHPAVEEVAALAHPSPHGEDDIRIVVAMKAGRTLDALALMEWLVGRMPCFMMPRYIEFIDCLPRNPMQKVEKYRLLQVGLSPEAWDREAVGYVLERTVAVALDAR